MYLQSQAQISLEPTATRRQYEPLADATIKVGPAPLFAAFAQLRAASIYGPNAPPSAQLAAYAVDQGHVTTLQFAAFMKLVLTQKPELRTHLPDLATLVKQYHVTSEYAFHLLRPFMNHFYVSYTDLLYLALFLTLKIDRCCAARRSATASDSTAHCQISRHCQRTVRRQNEPFKVKSVCHCRSITKYSQCGVVRDVLDTAPVRHSRARRTVQSVRESTAAETS